ncbi:MAG: hypothetical protein ACJAUP_000892 [Cellvibrionaceae bacterium]|jgi:hypothetical protein
MKFFLIMTSYTLAILSGCTWVNENTAGRNVTITAIDQVANCSQVGTISANVKHKLGFILRDRDKVTRELQILARNEAVALGADAIVADGAPNDGKQGYKAFSCP